MKSLITPVLLLPFLFAVVISGCGKKTEKTDDQTPAPLEVAGGGGASRYAYVLPAASAQFVFSDPAECSLQVMLNGQSVKNFVSNDLPLKVTVKHGSPDSLIFNTKKTGTLDVQVAFGIVEPTGFQSFLITSNEYTARQEGGIGTVDLRDVLRYVIKVNSCEMDLNWDTDSLYVSTETEECICVKSGEGAASEVLKGMSIPTCDF